MPPLIDLTGQKFNHLTAEYHVSGPSGLLWYCSCDCGKLKEKPISGYALKHGKPISCGCMDQNKRSTTHGKSQTKLYKVWGAMKHRCANKNDTHYFNYGGRGIKVCNEWLSFETFYEWAISKGYKQGLTIERDDSNGNYEPANCRWIPKSQQTENRRINKYITYKGVTKIMKHWARDLGLPYHLIQSRLKLGWAIEKAFNTPTIARDMLHARTVESNGKSKSIAGWARLAGMPYGMFYRKLSSGETVEQIIANSTF